MDTMYEDIWREFERELTIMINDIEKDTKQAMRRKGYTQVDEAFNNGARVALNSVKSKMRNIKRARLQREMLVLKQRP